MGELECFICHTHVETDHFNDHINNQHLKSLQIEFHFDTAKLELLKKHQNNPKSEEDEPLDYYWESLKFWFSGVCQFRDATMIAVEQQQQKMELSGGAGEFQSELFEDLVKFNSSQKGTQIHRVSQTDPTVIPSDLVSTQPEQKAEKPMRWLIDKSKNQSVRKRLSAKRRRSGLASIQTAADSEAVQPANLPVSITPLPEKSAENVEEFEKIFESIKLQLNKTECDEEMVDSWERLGNSCSVSVEDRQKFAIAGGIELFQQYYRKFGNRAQLVAKLIWLMRQVSDEKLFGQELLANGNLAILWKIWLKTNAKVIRYESFLIFTNLSSDSSISWPLGQPTMEDVKMKLTEEEEFWENKSFNRY